MINMKLLAVVTPPSIYHKTSVENYNKISTPGTVPNNWLGFSYICSENYDFGLISDET